MAESLTTWLLWVLAVLGGWNALNLFARWLCEQLSWRYSWSIFLGAWAGVILYARP